MSLASARALHRRLEGALGHGLPPAILVDAGVDGLRQLGVTRQKARYLTALAEQVASGALNLADLQTLPDDEVAARLIRCPGIGPWTASIYLLMALLRPDVWPENDLALNRMVGRMRREAAVVSSEAVLRYTARWRPWRAVAARILWHSYLSDRSKNPPTAAMAYGRPAAAGEADDES